MKIVKRNGDVVDFDKNKIYQAIKKASDSLPSETKNVSSNFLDILTDQVVDEACKLDEMSVEAVQDIVEKVLIAADFADLAKAYILYRQTHARIREAKDFLMETFQELNCKDASDIDIKRENANIDTDTAMGMMLKYGSTSANFFVDNYILPKEMADAHRDGNFHIHDKDFYLLTETCCQIDLLKLFDGGFHTGHGNLREPSNIISAAALACIAIQSNQNDQHGGQAVPNFDYALAPYVQKTYEKEYEDALDVYEQITDNIDYNYLHDFAAERATERTKRLTYQAMEALIHNLNTMHSRAGAQTPFSSLNYGTDTSWEGRLVIKCLLNATLAGLGNGETPIFPVQIFKIKEGVNYNEGDPNYDLFKLAMKTSAKRMFPNFSFLDAPFNKEFYTENGDWNHEVAYMGCRTRVMANIDKSHEVTSGRGNLSFTTINLPRIGLESKGNTDIFFDILTDRIDLVIRQLLHRYKIQCKKKVKNYPFLMGNGIWIDSDKLDWEDTIESVLKHGTLTIGFIGLAECLVALTGKHHGESEESQKLGLYIIKYMRIRCDRACKEHNLNFSLIATPSEGLAGRFVPLDRKRFGTLKGITDRKYYTNSFHVPVYYPIKAFQKIQIEAPYHALTNGGHITYVELDGDTAKNPEAFEKIIRYMHDQGVGYGSINHPIDRDPVCGYTGVINDVCPRCGRRESESVSVEKLRELRKKFSNVPKYD